MFKHHKLYQFSSPTGYIPTLRLTVSIIRKTLLQISSRHEEIIILTGSAMLQQNKSYQ